MAQREETSEGVVLLDTITKVTASHHGTVVVSGSHGGVYAGYCAAKERVRGVILSDAGVGKQGAGISSLEFLDRMKLAAATADSMSCRIADATDMWENGTVSHVNATARSVGCAPGQTVAECAVLLRSAGVSIHPVPSLGEARFVIQERMGAPSVIGVDSQSLVLAEDAGRIIVSGSHGGLVGGRPDTILPEGIFAAIYNDAGGCKQDSAFSRLPFLDQRGVGGITVSHMTARIGDARSTYSEGIVSRVNERAQALGGVEGMTVPELIRQLLNSHLASSDKTGA
jgi:hypothetical protein